MGGTSSEGQFSGGTSGGQISGGISSEGVFSSGANSEGKTSEASGTSLLKAGGTLQVDRLLYGRMAEPQGSSAVSLDGTSRVYSRTQPASADSPGAKLSSGANVASSGLQNPLGGALSTPQNPIIVATNGLQNPLSVAASGPPNPLRVIPTEVLSRAPTVPKLGNLGDRPHGELSVLTLPGHSATQQATSSGDGRILPTTATHERPGYLRQVPQGSTLAPLGDADIPLIPSPPPNSQDTSETSSPRKTAPQVPNGVPTLVQHPSGAVPWDHVTLEAVPESAGRPVTTPGARPGSEPEGSAFEHEHGEEVQKHILEELNRLEREPDRGASKEGSLFPWGGTSKYGRTGQAVALSSNRHDVTTGGRQPPASQGGARTGAVLKGDPNALAAQSVERLLNRGGASLVALPILESTRVAEREAAEAVAKTGTLASAEAATKISTSGVAGPAATTSVSGSAEDAAKTSASAVTGASNSVTLEADANARAIELSHGGAVPRTEYVGPGVSMQDAVLAQVRDHKVRVSSGFGPAQLMHVPTAQSPPPSVTL